MSPQPPSPARRAALPALVTGIVLGILLGIPGGPRRAEAHVPPPAFLVVHVADDATVVQVAAQIGLLRDWVGIEPRFLRRPGPIDAKHLPRIERKLASWLELRVDGVAQRLAFEGGAVEAFEDHLTTWHYARLTFRASTRVAPRQVEFVWRRYADGTNYLFEHLDVELDAYDTMRDVRLTPAEPSHVWHRPAELPAEVPVVLPAPIAPAPLEVPALSFLVLLLALGLLLLRRRRWDALRRSQVLGVGLGLGAALLPVGRVDLRALDLGWLGLGGPAGITRPADDEALAIFASLHRGLYAAVGEEEGERVYDRLAPIVAQEILPRLYLDIQQSMILHAQGGAVARIHKTDLVSTALQPATPDAAEAPWFVVRARWRVEGRVGHWGHTHHRVNEYLADVTVAAIGDRWKIARIETLDQTRVDDGGTPMGGVDGTNDGDGADGTGPRDDGAASASGRVGAPPGPDDGR